MAEENAAVADDVARVRQFDVGKLLERACAARLDRDKKRDKWFTEARERMNRDVFEPTASERHALEYYTRARDEDAALWQKLGLAIGNSPEAIARLAPLVPHRTITEA